MTTYGVTGATGNLGRLALDALLQLVPPGDIVALARNPAALADHAAKGVTVRAADYDAPEGLPAALAGIDRLLLISASTLGERPRQHGNVIDAAKQAGVGFIAYTSILRADDTPIRLGEEHKASEEKLGASGIPHALIRNGWYNENYVLNLPYQVETGVITGAQGQGRISSAARADLAAGAVRVLIDGKAGDVFNLAGDASWTMADFAAELSRQSGKPVRYEDMSEADFAASLVAAGLPAHYAPVFANSAFATSQGALEDNSGTLGKLIGRPTTPIAETIRQALQG